MEIWLLEKQNVIFLSPSNIQWELRIEIWEAEGKHHFHEESLS